MANNFSRGVAEFSNQDIFVVSKPGHSSFGAIGEKELGFFFSVGRGRQDGMMACGMETKHDLGARRAFEAHALRADGNAPISAGFQGGAHAPNIRPPGTSGDGSQDGAFFFFGH